MCICVCEGCLDKYIRVAIWPPQTKIPSSALEETCLRGICDRNGRYIACSQFYFCMMWKNPKSFAGIATFYNRSLQRLIQEKCKKQKETHMLNPKSHLIHTNVSNPTLH